MENKIIIKRIVRKKKHAHGGMWKVAYADFMTAMMVLFLMLWVISIATEEQLVGLGNYFAPTIFQGKSQHDIQSQSQGQSAQAYHFSNLSKELQERFTSIEKNISVTEK